MRTWAERNRGPGLTDVLATAMALRRSRQQEQQQQQQQEQNQWQFERAKAEDERQQDFRTLLAGPNPSEAALADPAAYQAYVKTQNDARLAKLQEQKAQADIAKTQGEAVDAEQKRNQTAQQLVFGALAQNPNDPVTYAKAKEARDNYVKNFGIKHFALPGEDASPDGAPTQVNQSELEAARRAAGWKDPREEPTGAIKDFEYGQKNPEFRQEQIDLATAKSGQPIEVRATNLRKEFLAHKDVQNYGVMQDAIAKARAASANGPGDIGLIFNYMKLLDPGSTVREGEFAQAVASGGVPSQIAALFNKVQGAGVLDNATRKMVRAETEKIATAQEQRYQKQVDYYSRIARKNGLDTFDVTGLEDQRDVPGGPRRRTPKVTPQQAQSFLNELDGM